MPISATKHHPFKRGIPVEVCYTINPSIMLWRDKNTLTFGRGTSCSLAIILPCGVGGIDQLESFGFRGRKSCIKNVEIFAVGKIAEFARFAGGERRKSPDLISLYERSELLGRGHIESLRALGADADKDINLSVNVRWGLDGRLLWLS